MRLSRNRVLWLGALLEAAFLGGCSDSGSNKLVATSTQPADSTCPQGSLVVNTGTDDNDNGVLDKDEIEDTTVVCHAAGGNAGSDGAASLVKTTSVDLGDAHCPTGGQRTDLGLDTNGDNVLDDGEITSTSYTCNGHGFGEPVGFAKPEGPAAQFTLKANGGRGHSGSGGSGGEIEVDVSYGSGGGHFKIFDTGVADASFTVPAHTANLGPSPAFVRGEVQVKDFVTPAHNAAPPFQNPEPGELHMHQAVDNYLWRYDPQLGDVRVTGVLVDTGAKLILGPQNFVCCTHTIELGYDFVNLGTVVLSYQQAAAGYAPSRFSLDLETTGAFVSGPHSRIEAAGDDAAPGQGGGGSGGSVDIEAGVIINEGDIDTSGGDADGTSSWASAGSGGGVTLTAYTGSPLNNGIGPLYNTGSIDTRGGAGKDNAQYGGSGGGVYFETDYASIFNAGAINTSGGFGDYGGGTGGYVEMYAEYVGDIRNRGNITASGGNARQSQAGSAYDADRAIMFYPYGGELVNSGNLVARGGTCAEDCTAGNGGGVYIYTTSSSSWDNDSFGRSLIISGNIDTSGGDGFSGGEAGDVYVYGEFDYYPARQEIVFLGYASFSTDGGSGSQSGGNAGGYSLYQEYGEDDWSTGVPGGAIFSYVPFSGRGGYSESNNAGTGATVDWQTSWDYYSGPSSAFVPTNWEVLESHGGIDVRGGDSSTGYGGGGGSVYMWGKHGVASSGPINASGGNGAYSGGDCGEYNSIYLYSDGPIVNEGPLTLAGGNATGSGGSGGDGCYVELGSRTRVENSGSVDLHGGNGDTHEGSGGSGGDGGTLYLVGSLEGATNTGAVTLAPGAGESPGEPGLLNEMGSVTHPAQ